VGGVGVEIATQAVGFDGDVHDAAPRGAFEDGVFDKMANAVEIGRFVARAALDPDADGGGTKAGHLLGQDGRAVLKFG
jgi:hypothetical protein